MNRSLNKPEQAAPDMEETPALEEWSWGQASTAPGRGTEPLAHVPLCLERRGLVLVSNKEQCGTLLQCTWITYVKNVSGPGVGELPRPGLCSSE